VLCILFPEREGEIFKLKVTPREKNWGVPIASQARGKGEKGRGKERKVPSAKLLKKKERGSEGEKR